MGQPLKDLRRRIEELYLISTGKLSYPMCQTMLESDYPALAAELQRLRPEGAEGEDADRARLEEARANLQAKLDRYEAINRRWNLKTSSPELRRYLA